ncbi:hypothetical protein CQW23_28238 [Capsicum baccatum]|uniref:Uncharacterized protein n=1 Tax=Capsicum baccatum TaxID=33114 RepID=A0A2G2VFY8_CAPBA|nr:hypothetical protein CQW23_28238 [Capsicum baccatum]
MNVEHEDDEDYEETMSALTGIGSYSHTPKQPNLDLKNQPSPIAKTFIEEPPELESKKLPNYLKHACLESGNTLPVSMANDLSEQHVKALISALKRYMRAMGRKIDDIIGIPPGICTMAPKDKKSNHFIKRPEKGKKRARLGSHERRRIHLGEIPNSGCSSIGNWVTKKVARFSFYATTEFSRVVNAALNYS